MKCSECERDFETCSGLIFEMRVINTTDNPRMDYVYRTITGRFCSPACMKDRLNRYHGMKDSEVETLDKPLKHAIGCPYGR